MPLINNIKVAPYFLARIAQQPFENIKKLDFAKTNLCIQKILSIETWQTEHKNKICDYLFKAVPLASTNNDRQTLIDLRRQIYNTRNITFHHLEIAKHYLLAEIISLLAQWYRYQEQINDLLHVLNSIFQDELEEKRLLLKQTVKNENFLKGIQLSSGTLYQGINKYFDYQFTNTGLPKAIRDIELSLINYLTRMITKASPFGAFTAIGVGGFVEQNNAIPANIDITKTKSFITFNRAFLLQYERLISKINKIKKHLPLRVNNTLKVYDKHIIYFKRGADGTEHAFSNEVFVKLSLDHALATILQIISENKYVLPFCDLVNRISYSYDNNDNLSYTPLEVEAYIQKLIDIQLLESHFMIPDHTQDFLGALIDRLSLINVEEAQILCSSFLQLREIETNFAVQTQEQRAQSYKECVQITQAIDSYLQKEPNPYIDAAKTLIYEDVKLEQECKLNQNICTRLESNFHAIQALADIFDDQFMQKIFFTQLFVSKYGIGGRCEDLLDYYQFYARMPKAEKEGVALQNKSPELTARINTTHKLRGAFFELLQQELRQSKLEQVPTNEITISPETLLNLALCFDKELDLLNSRSLYCQLINNNSTSDSPVLILDKIGNGFGKYFSRFCYMFNESIEDSNIMQQIRSQKQNGHDNIIYADLCAVLGVNVNLHPQLCQYEVVYPGCTSMLPKDQQISLSDLKIIHNIEQDRLMLWSKAHDKEVSLLPLGFLFPRLAPPLYNFLCYFSPAGWVNLSIWDRYDQWVGSKEQIRYYPRLKLGNIILERATWKVEQSYLPKQMPHEADSLYFLRIQKWQSQNSLPEEVFVRLLSPVALFANEKGNKSLAEILDIMSVSKSRKPQYINFRNFFHVNLLNKLITSSKDLVTFQENSPSLDEMASFGDHKHHVSEFLFEVYY